MTPSEKYTLIPGDLIDHTVDCKVTGNNLVIERKHRTKIQVIDIRWSWRGLRWTVELRVDYDPV